MAKDIQALKAVSQNLMHSNISITDGVYGILSNNDVRGQIAGLGQINRNESKNTGGIIDIDLVYSIAERVVERLNNSKIKKEYERL